MQLPKPQSQLFESAPELACKATLDLASPNHMATQLQKALLLPHDDVLR